MMYGLLIGLIIWGLIVSRSNTVKAGVSDTVNLVRTSWMILGQGVWITALLALIGLIIRGA